MAIRLSMNQINYLNIWMMIVAAIAAWLKPFETFLFAYAFLGPLHYLTEISWLHDRRYFSRGRYDSLFLVAAGMLITLVYFRMVPHIPGGAAAAIIFVAFAASLIFILVQRAAARIGLIALAAIGGAWFARDPAFGAVFGIFLPTLIHVSVFTGLFILLGALRGRSLSGLLSLMAFALISIGILYRQPASATYHVSEYARNSYGFLQHDGSWTDGFAGLNYQILTALGLHDFGSPSAGIFRFVGSVNDFIYRDPLALALMSFIAFAYLYHYLNWFSKTSVIGWHAIPRSRLAAIVILWTAMLLLYAFDYADGLKALYFLSITHVLLEFPLNHRTFINIVKEIAANLRTGDARLAA